MSIPDDPIRLHVAGAIVRHRGFSDLPTYRNPTELTQEFIDRWVVPYYMQVGSSLEPEWEEQLRQVKPHLTRDVVQALLGDFNWRTRQTGAYFAALRNDSDLLDVIGTHLLKSDVCYAGRVYALVLAYFNHEKSAQYLDQYLTYYLAQPQLWFDQAEAMQALAYLDKVNGTSLLARHWPAWDAFLANKPNWSREVSLERLEAQLALLRRLSTTGPGEPQSGGKR
ncbi:MAG TPA: DUF6000 family protein [Myxococcaceae bacterium]|jgi:hypothetical protein